MATWRLAPSLAQLRREVNAKFPRRDKRSDGDIGDRAHRNTRSDHNPYAGYVHALDIDKDGVNVSEIVRAAKAHPSVNYIIWNRVIYTRASGFRARRYTGANPHTLHVHISISRTPSARNSTRRWLVAGAPAPRPATPPPVRRADRVLRVEKPLMRGNDVAGVQAALARLGYRVSRDAVYGPQTAEAVRRFQMTRRLTADGVVGPLTLAALRRV